MPQFFNNNVGFSPTTSCQSTLGGPLAGWYEPSKAERSVIRPLQSQILTVQTTPAAGNPPWTPWIQVGYSPPDLIPLPNIQVSQAGIAATVVPFLLPPKPVWRDPDLIPLPSVISYQGVTPPPPVRIVFPTPLTLPPDLIPLPAVQTSQAGQAAAVIPLTLWPIPKWKDPDLIPLPPIQISRSAAGAVVAFLFGAPRPRYRDPDLIPLPSVQVARGIPPVIAPVPYATWPLPKDLPPQMIPLPGVQVSQAGLAAAVSFLFGSQGPRYQAPNLIPLPGIQVFRGITLPIPFAVWPIPQSSLPWIVTIPAAVVLPTSAVQPTSAPILIYKLPDLISLSVAGILPLPKQVLFIPYPPLIYTSPGLIQLPGPLVFVGLPPYLMFAMRTILHLRQKIKLILEANK